MTVSEGSCIISELCSITTRFLITFGFHSPDKQSTENFFAPDKAFTLRFNYSSRTNAYNNYEGTSIFNMRALVPVCCVTNLRGAKINTIITVTALLKQIWVI